MKKAPFCILSLVLISHGSFASSIDSISRNVKEVCHEPSKSGKYWTIAATGKADAKGTLRVINAAIDGEATFTKGEWDGVQQVLKEHQGDENKSYRNCVETIMPLFLEKFADSGEDDNKNNNDKSVNIKGGVHQETHGDNAPAIFSGRDTNTE